MSPSSSASESELDYRPWLAAALAGVAIAALVASAGGALLVTASWPMVGGATDGAGGRSITVGISLLATGCAGLLLAGFYAYRLGLCGKPTDCDRYGRHIAALTFLLLVVALGNAVGTSVMALDGGFEISVEVLADRATAAAALTTATHVQRAAQTKSRQATRALAVATADAREACPRSTDGTVGAASPACLQARANERQAQTTQWEAADAKQEADKAVEEAKKNAQENCSACRRALFILLLLSTLTALSGAVFYVVNSVRMKRPGLPGESSGGAQYEGSAGSRTSESGESGKQGSVTTEPFDAYAFWGGTFFRIGEAVLFTFAFFWLLWTFDLYAQLVWLPVVALFLGMFVRAGEAIVFRLGMRVLSAAEALLPLSSTLPAERSPTPPVRNDRPPPSEKRESATANVDARSAAPNGAGARPVPDGSGQAV